ncbi:unnamed protein product, partial [Medioppia subpectinata]
LTRLLYDYNRPLYQHFEAHDISPTLYAAPWFLTLFASQFSISFVTRLFDILFLMGIEAIFRVSLVILDNHTASILQCDCFETIMEYLKESVPAMDTAAIEAIYDRVFALYDISAQLRVYEVEYRVFQEELSIISAANSRPAVTGSPSRAGSITGGHKAKHSQQSQHMETTDREAVEELTARCQEWQSKCAQADAQCDGYQSTIRRLEQRLRACEDEKDALVHSVNALQKRNEKLERLHNESQEPNDDGIKNKSRSDRFSLSSAPVFSISRASESQSADGQSSAAEANGSSDGHDYDGDDLAVDEDDIDINESDSDCGADKDSDDRHPVPFDRTQSDTSNLSI